jgi:type I restriction enzyme M protein
MAKNNNGANLGFERELWQAADALRSNMDAAEYKHVVLGLILLKYISDLFEEQHARLDAERAERADGEVRHKLDKLIWANLMDIGFGR